MVLASHQRKKRDTKHVRVQCGSKPDRLCEHIHHLLFFLTIDIATFALIIK